jgi:azurin
MQHNWVLTAPGTADKVAQESITAGAAKGWLALSPNVLAHTKLVDPKKSDTVEFVAPTKPGDYPFICSFPGHAMTMKGTLTVK